jgi:hypothetical protein
MRLSIICLFGMIAVIVIAAYGEFVLDFRGAHSQLKSESTLAAITLTSYGDRDSKLKEARAKYGDRVRAQDDVSAGTFDGKWTITVDDSVIEQGPITVTLAGMYGLFAVTSEQTIQGIFPFDIDPPMPKLSGVPKVNRLQERFENFPKKFLAFSDDDVSLDSCQAPEPPAFEIGLLAKWLPIQSQAFCIAHWKGPRPASMLIGVTLANGDPWMRPFTRWICRSMTLAALGKLASPDRQLPTYAACVLVDRAGRRKPRDAHDAFETVVYEIRDRTLARMN